MSFEFPSARRGAWEGLTVKDQIGQRGFGRNGERRGKIVLSVC